MVGLAGNCLYRIVRCGWRGRGAFLISWTDIDSVVDIDLIMRIPLFSRAWRTVLVLFFRVIMLVFL